MYQKNFIKDGHSAVSLSGTVWTFSVNNSSIKREYILNIHQYFMVKNNLK